MVRNGRSGTELEAQPSLRPTVHAPQVAGTFTSLLGKVEIKQTDSDEHTSYKVRDSLSAKY